jgi:hypothetical protein
MVRPRKFKEQLDRPPHRPLTKEEVEHIARAGGIEFGNRAEEFSEFEQALEFIRRRHKPEAYWKRLSLTDNQIRDCLGEMRALARQLHKLLSDPAFNCQTHILIEGEDEPCDQEPPELKPLMGMIRRAELGLVRLKERSAKYPNDWALKPRQMLGGNQLLVELIHLWQVATNTLKPQAEKNSALIPFLREGACIIAQNPVNLPTALGWARDLVPRAYKHLDLGYLPLRPATDPALLRLIMDGSDALNRLY